MRVLSDFEKLLIIFGISLLFMFIIIIIFHFFRKHRKDKLITHKYNTRFIEEDDDNDIRSSNTILDTSDFRNKANTLFISTKEKLKRLRNLSKDYSFLGWIKFVYNTDDNQIFNLCNAEGFLYLYFLKSAGIFFFGLSFSSILIMIPIYLVKYESNPISLLQKLTIENAYDSTEKLYIVLFMSFIYTLLAYFFIYDFRKKLVYIQERVKMEDSLDLDIARHTIHIRGLNENLSYTEAKKILHTYFNISFTDMISEIQVIPHYDILMNLIDKKFESESLLDRYEKLNLKNPFKRNKVQKGVLCYKKEIDGEIYFANWVRIINNMLAFYRKLNVKSNTGNAFISFKYPSLAQKILENKKLIYNKSDTFYGQLLKVKNWTISSAPPPSDLIWENIKYKKEFRILKSIIFTSILFIVCLIIITPYKIRQELDPLINQISDTVNDKDIKRFILEYSYPLIVVLVNSGVLPFVVYYIAYFENHYKRSYREKSILVKTFTFMTINSLFIPTLGILDLEKISNFIIHVKENGWDFDLSEAFIKNSYFFMRYIVQCTFLSNSLQLLALPQYLVKKIRILIAQTDYEKFYASLIKKYFDYGYNYSFSVTVFALTFCFSTTIPLIVPFGGLFFFIKYFVDKYNLLFVFPVEFESNGNICYIVIKFVLMSIFFFQFITSNIFLKLANKELAIYASFLYMCFAIILYYGSKKIFSKKNKNVGESNQILNLIISKTRKILFTTNEINNLKTPLNSEKKFSTNNNDFEKLLREAYIHPTEKNMTNNPIQIWNDSYSFVKRNDSNSILKSCNMIEYENIISRMRRENSI